MTWARSGACTPRTPRPPLRGSPARASCVAAGPANCEKSKQRPTREGSKKEGGYPKKVLHVSSRHCVFPRDRERLTHTRCVSSNAFPPSSCGACLQFSTRQDTDSLLVLALCRSLTHLLFPSPFGTARSRFLPFLGCRPAHPPPVPAVRFLHSGWCRSAAAAASPVFRSSDGAAAELHGWLRVPSLSLGSALPCFLNLWYRRRARPAVA